MFCPLVLLACGCVSKPEPPPVRPPLRIELRPHAGDWAYFLNGETAPVSNEGLIARLSKHAEIVDPAAGFAGRDQVGQSRNPVVFSAPPEAPAKPFWIAFDGLVQAMITTMRVELSRPGSPPLGCRVELPRDDSLRGPARRVSLRIEATVQRDVAEFEVGLTAFRRQFVPDAKIDPSQADAWSERAFVKRRNSLLDALIELKKVREPDDAHLLWHPDTAWGALFQALDVLDQLMRVHGIVTEFTSGELAEPPPPESD